jgi:Uma2 family endonuclease
MGIQSITARPEVEGWNLSVGHWPVQGQWRYEHLRTLPDDGRRYEIIDGTLYMVGAPSYDHQVTTGELFFHLQRAVGRQGRGLIDCAPAGVYLAEQGQLVQPDIAIWLDGQPAYDGAVYTGAPSLVVEVMAPGAARHDRVVKFDLYEAAGVQEYWLADLATCSIEIYTLSHGEYALAGRFTNGDLIQSPLLPDLKVRNRLLFNL